MSLQVSASTVCPTAGKRVEGLTSRGNAFYTPFLPGSAFSVVAGLPAMLLSWTSLVFYYCRALELRSDIPVAVLSHSKGCHRHHDTSLKTAKILSRVTWPILALRSAHNHGQATQPCFSVSASLTGASLWKLPPGTVLRITWETCEDRLAPCLMQSILETVPRN